MLNDNNNNTEETTAINTDEKGKQQDTQKDNSQWSTFDTWEKSMDSAIGGWGGSDEWK